MGRLHYDPYYGTLGQEHLTVCTKAGHMMAQKKQRANKPVALHMSGVPARLQHRPSTRNPDTLGL